MRVAEQVEADPNVVFDSLLEIVLPEEAGKPPFLGVYSYLGGENGFYRSPAADLGHWGVVADRVGDLKTQIAQKRSQNLEPLSEEEKTVRLDAVEFALALESGDRETASAFEKKFRKTPRSSSLRNVSKTKRCSKKSVPKAVSISSESTGFSN